MFCCAEACEMFQGNGSFGGSFTKWKALIDEGKRTIAAESDPTSGGVVTLKTGRRDVPGLNPGSACRSSRLEFSVVFSESRVNTG